MFRVICAVIAALLFPQTLSAQSIQWTDFPPHQSLLSFDAPGLPVPPTRAVEGHRIGAGKSNVRNFGYVFNTAFVPGAFAQVYVSSISAELTSFSNAPSYDSLISTFYQEFKGRPIQWTDSTAQTAPAPIGPTNFRRFVVSDRSCLSFGGVYGSAPSAAFSGGSYGKGSEQIFGFYCAPKDYQLSEADSALVLSRLGFGSLGKPNGAAPKSFETPSVRAANPPAATSLPPAGLQERKLVVLWEGYSGGLTGTVLFNSNSSATRLEIHIPSEAQTCIGVSSLKQSGDGEWTVQCPNGISANGTFKALGTSRGSVGEGIDNKGAKITFVVAGRS